MIITFNSFNMAYSFGVLVTYGQNNPNFIIEVAAGVASLILPVAAMCMLAFSSKEGFGEFSALYRPDLMSQCYFIVTLAYRIALGFSMSRLNEVEEATITNVFYAVIFMMYLMVNVPYKDGYHNYRAIIHGGTQLTILSVTMFYRSMKSTSAPDAAYTIFTPAILEIAAIFLCIGSSAGSLVY